MLKTVMAQEFAFKKKNGGGGGGGGGGGVRGGAGREEVRTYQLHCLVEVMVVYVHFVLGHALVGLIV